MSEEEMVQLVQNALVKRGVSDKVVAVGEFNPRGHTGAMFAGGLAGSELDPSGGLAGSIATGVAPSRGCMPTMPPPAFRAGC